jgi:protein-S-isoprenylcysteine O-methyltransferase Ste14
MLSSSNEAGIEAAVTRRSILSVLELKMSPVMMTILLAALMWFLARSTQSYPVAQELRITALLLLVGTGTAVGLAGVWSFRRARTTVNPWRPHASSELVVSGVYRRTRNPMYLGLLLALVGWGIYLANALAIALALGFVPYMNRFQIQPEERALGRTYGDAYEDYCMRVRRWL